MKAEKLKSGSYRVRVMVKGVRYSFTGKNKKDVLRKARIFVEENDAPVENPTFADAMESYIAENSLVLSPSTIRAYVSLKKRLLRTEPLFCSKRLVNIETKDVQKVINNLGLSPKSARNYLGFISVVIGKTFGVKLPQKVKSPINIPTDLEVAGLLILFKDTELEIPILLAAYGPLRRGEISPLTLDDFDGDFVSITKDRVRIICINGSQRENWITKPPKTYSSNRRILLPHYVVVKIRNKGYVTTLNPDQISRKFREGQLRIGVENPYNFHSLRHYCASTLHAQNIPDEYIMQRGGWATPNVLQSVYRHTLSDQEKYMSEKAVKHFEAVTKSVTN